MRRLALFVLGIVFLSSANGQTTAGATPGSFRVTDTGAAEYRIPIQVPPGIAGMEPKLALVYNSQAGNGLLGVGWSLEGLSSITRCPRTVAQDGVRGGINYNADDRFCLDGQRLVAISGDYGAAGTEYRTERESFSKIVSYGTAGNGPAWFRLWTKSGQILEYGNTADSRIEAQGKTTVRVWATNKVSDSGGNYFSVSYTEDNPNGDFYPRRIDYTGSADAGLSTHSFVCLVYGNNPAVTPACDAPSTTTRPDIAPYYEAGSVVRGAKRLSHINTYADAVLVRAYRLTYDNNGASGPSRLTNVQECGNAGVCLPATMMGWEQSPAGLPRITPAWFQPEIGGWDAYQLYIADLNGDGRSDLVWNARNESNVTYVALSNGDGSFTRIPGAWYQPEVGGWGAYQLYIADINGDGRSDLLWNARDESNVTYVALSNGDGSFTRVPGAWYQPEVGGWGSYQLYVADINGDGRSDLVWNARNESNVTYVALSNGDGSFTRVPGAWYQPEVGGWGAYQLYVADINGDGRSDLLWNARGDSNVTYVALSNGDGSFTRVPGAWYQPEVGGWGAYQLYVADINGDGRSDLVWNARNESNVTYVALSNGDGSFTRVPGAWYQPEVGGWGAYQLYIADINGDGRSDLVWNARNESNVTYVALSNGDGSFTRIPGAWYQPEVGGWGAYQLYVADVNGDGRSDLLWNARGDSNVTIANQSAFNDANKLVTLTDGLGIQTAIAYKPLTDDGAYTKGHGAIYPDVDFQGPLYVVSSHTIRDAGSLSLTTNYKYREARRHRQGGGFLGFRNVEATDVQTDVKTATSFRQDYPFQGLLSSSIKTPPGGAPLSQVTQTWADSLFPSSSGKYHRADLVRKVEVENDLNGASLFTATATTAYDSFGNATSVTVSIGDVISKSTTNSYANDPVTWRLGRLTRSTVESASP